MIMTMVSFKDDCDKPRQADFSENAEKAISFAIRIADKAKAQLLVLFVYHPYINDTALPEYIGSLEIYKELEASYREKLDEAVALARRQGVLAEGIWATAAMHQKGEKQIA